MADPRIITLPIALRADSINVYVQFSPDGVEWVTVRHEDQEVFDADQDSRFVLLDGVNADDDDDTSNLHEATTPPMQYRYRLEDEDGKKTAWYPPVIVPSIDDFVARMKQELKDPSLVSGRALLTNLDYRQRVAMAVTAFERVHPRMTSQQFALTSNVQSYSLPDDWDNNFSSVTQCEYPINSDPRSFVPADFVFWDEQVNQWRFTRIYPGAQESARIYFTCRHARDGSTIPVSNFESVLLWAVGDAAEQLQKFHNQFGDFQAGAEFVITDPRVKRWGEMAKSSKTQAVAMWGSTGTGVRSHIPAYDDHGRIPPSVWSA